MQLFAYGGAVINIQLAAKAQAVVEEIKKAGGDAIAVSGDGRCHAQQLPTAHY